MAKKTEQPAYQFSLKRFLFIVVIVACVVLLGQLIMSYIFPQTTQGETPTDASGAVTGAIKATITMQSGSEIKLELYPEQAPISVQNFVDLAQAGFYDGLTFHRIIPGFVIQGGDPNGDGTGGAGNTIKGEFSANGVDNPLKHLAGSLSMARRGNDMDSATSQFFICLADLPNLDGDYAVFGMVTTGIDVVNAIAAVETDNNDKPIEAQVIKTITIEGN